MSIDLPTVAVVTSHGRKVLEVLEGERLVDTLRRNGVPWSATSLYGMRKDDGSAELLSGLDEPLTHFGMYKDIFVYFNRNVNPFLFSLDNFNVITSERSEENSTEYFYQMLKNSEGAVQNNLAKLSPEDCRDIIADRVEDVISDNVEPGASIVVGVSGGGDSNAMLYGLSKAAEAGLKIHPVIVMGIPDWDAGVPRAQDLCEKYGLDLTVLTEADIREMMGVPNDNVSLVERFEREFKGDDFEFLGTLIIRIALSKYAEKMGTDYICTGLNLEDVVCEQFFRMSNGLKAAGMPTRRIGEKTLLMPLWMCPKRIIDGCFPKYSLDNYEARYPCFSLGRNLYYSVVYHMQSNFPSFIETMAMGLSKLAEEDPVEYQLDEGLGVHVERFVPLPLRHRFLNMLGNRIEH